MWLFLFFFTSRPWQEVWNRFHAIQYIWRIHRIWWNPQSCDCLEWSLKTNLVFANQSCLRKTLNSSDTNMFFRKSGPDIFLYDDNVLGIIGRFWLLYFSHWRQMIFRKPFKINCVIQWFNLCRFFSYSCQIQHSLSFIEFNWVVPFGKCGQNDKKNCKPVRKNQFITEDISLFFSRLLNQFRSSL